MAAAHEQAFPLFPLGMVALPSEVVPLHIFEERYKAMVGLCIAEQREFGIVWMADDELHEIGCACTIEQVLEVLDDGRMNIVALGTRPFRIIRREPGLPYPAGEVEFLIDRDEPIDEDALRTAREAFAQLVSRATDKDPASAELTGLDAFGMAARVDFGNEAKQGILDLRSENLRLGLVTRLFRAAAKRLDFVDTAQTRARSNGKVRFA